VTEEELDTVQKILEGKCLECSAVLPEHSVHCSLYEVNIVNRKLKNIKQYITDQQTKLQKLVESVAKTQMENEQLFSMIEERINKLKHIQETRSKDV
jgi:septal ring factor EnvC (AmiA/AmiB activator)